MSTHAFGYFGGTAGPPPGERRLGGEHDAHRREECNGDGGGPAGAMESFRSHKSRVFGCVARRDGF